MFRTTLFPTVCSLLSFVAIGFGSQLLAQQDPTMDGSTPTQANFEGDFFFSDYEVGTNSKPNNVVQRSGSLTIGGELSIDNGRYELQDGRLSANTLQFSSLPVLRWGDPIIPAGPFWGTTIPGIRSFDPLLTTVLDFDESNESEPILEPEENFIPTQDFALPLISRDQVFWQKGGEVSIREAVNLQSGNLIVDAGIFSAESMVINGENFAFRKTEFQQNGGRSTFGSILIDNGSLAMNGGTLKATSLAMGDPASQSFSFNRSPEVIHTGGNVGVSGNLELCIPGSTLPFTPGELVPIFPFESVSYRLSDGNLSVGGDLIVGSMGAAPAEFTQTGGKNHVVGTLRIEGTGSNYALQAGELAVNRLHVATNLFNTQGTFTMLDGATLNVGEEVIFGIDADFGADAGSTMNLSGSTFSILGSNALALAGLDSLSLVLGGSDEITSLEVAGKDLGNVDEGFDMNFSLFSLQIGDEEAAHVQLVDLIKNHFERDGNDAIYVDTLHLTAGSKLDLNGLEIYYRELHLGESASIIGDAIAVPEPAAMWPLLVGLLGMTSVRKRKTRAELIS